MGIRIASYKQMRAVTRLTSLRSALGGVVPAVLACGTLVGLGEVAIESLTSDEQFSASIVLQFRSVIVGEMAFNYLSGSLSLSSVCVCVRVRMRVCVCVF